MKFASDSVATAFASTSSGARRPEDDDARGDAHRSGRTPCSCGAAIRSIRAVPASPRRDRRCPPIGRWISIRTSRSVDGSISRYACKKSSRVTVSRSGFGRITSAWSRCRAGCAAGIAWRPPSRGRDIGADISVGEARELLQVDVFRQWHAARVNLEDLEAAVAIRHADLDLPVEPAGPTQRGSSAFGRFVAPITTTLPRA